MKKNLFKFMALAIAAMTFAACEDVPSPYDFPTNSDDNGGGSSVTIDPAGSGTLADPFNVAAALAKCTEVGETGTATDVYAKGYITEISEISTSYGNATFKISDTKNGDNELTIYRAYSLGNQKFTKDDEIKVGDEVVICGKLVNFKSNTPEFTQGCYIVSINGSGGGDTPDTPTDEVKKVTVAEFNAAAESDDVWYELTGTVTNLKDGDQYGNFDLVDASGSVYVYGLLSEKGGEKKKFQELVAAKGIKEGSKITIIGTRSSYNGKIQVKNAYFVSVENGSTPDTPTTEVKKVTVAEFNAAAESDDVWYQLTGTVTNLKDGDKFGNFDLVDATGSVYVYGLLSEKGGEKKLFQELVAAKGIKEGSTITIIGTRGSYNGKIEVMNAYFVSIEEGGNNGGGEAATGADGSTIISVADFNAAEESTEVWYQLTGKVTNLKDGDQYGNFDLVDATGSVYVYGVLSEKGGAKKKFQELVAAKGIKEGSTITIVGNRGSYNGKIEVMNAYFISVSN